MDPRTFLPGPRVAVSAPPRVGDRAPRSDDRLGRAPAVIAFLRHVGCPFAEATLLSLREMGERSGGVSVVAVSHAPRGATESWCRAVAGGSGPVLIVVDETRELYGDWGLGRSSLSHFMGRRSLRGVATLARTGIRNRHPVGTRWQSAGTFAVDGDGVVRYVHLPGHAGDLPDLEKALAAAAGG